MTGTGMKTNGVGRFVDWLNHDFDMGFMRDFVAAAQASTTDELADELGLDLDTVEALCRRNSIVTKGGGRIAGLPRGGKAVYAGAGRK